MPNFRSLVGGYFSSTPTDKTTPVSIRMNNPGAVNGAAWERTYPGYVSEVETTPGNRSTIFETPEYGVAVWYELMKKYRVAGAKTVRDIIVRYGGTAQAARYEREYVPDVVARTGLSANHEIKLTGDDDTLLKFAKAMFRHEAGRDTPLSDAQILYGFNFARSHAAGSATVPMPPTPRPTRPPPLAPTPEVPVIAPVRPGFFAAIIAFFAALFGPRKLAVARILKRGDSGDDVRRLQERLHKIGYSDIVVDGEFGEVTQSAVRKFQTAMNLDPDGEVGELTLADLNNTTTVVDKPPLLPPSTAKYGEPPAWYVAAVKDIGFRETGVNRGIGHFIAGAKTGSLGDPWCAIVINYWIEMSGYPGSRSAMARSFENNTNFIKLSQPALGCIVTMWRGSKSSGSGHVFLYDGESTKGVRGIGGNEDDRIKRSFHDRARITGYWYPKTAPTPRLGKIIVSDDGSVAGSEV